MALFPTTRPFSKERHGHFREAEAFRRVFEQVVGTCMSAGLVGGKGFAVDASVIEADASHALRVEGSALPLGWSDPATAARTLRGYLAAPDKAAGSVAEPEGETTFERVAAEPAPAKSLSLTGPAPWLGLPRACARSASPAARTTLST